MPLHTCPTSPSASSTPWWGFCRWRHCCSDPDQEKTGDKRQTQTNKTALSLVGVPGFDSEQAREATLPGLHNEGGRQQMSHRDRPNSIPSPWRRADLFSSTASTQKRVKDAARRPFNSARCNNNNNLDGDTSAATSVALINFYLHYLITYNHLQRFILQPAPLVVLSWSLSSFSDLFIYLFKTLLFRGPTVTDLHQPHDEQHCRRPDLAVTALPC